MSDPRYPKRSGPGDYDDLVDTPRETASGQSNDPLAELARLIDEDPFADFHQRRREPPLTEEQPRARGVVSQPPAEVQPNEYDPPEPEGDAGEQAAAPAEPTAYSNASYAEPARSADYDALDAPLYREPRPSDPADHEPAAYEPPAYEPPAYETSGHEPPAREVPTDDVTGEEPAPQEAQPREPSAYEPRVLEPRVLEPRVAEDRVPEDRAPEAHVSEARDSQTSRYETPSFAQAPIAPPRREPEIYREPEVYAAPADPEPSHVEPEFEEDVYEEDAVDAAAAERLYADLAAASQRVEPPMESTMEPPAPRVEAAAAPLVPPAGPAGGYDPAADLEAGLAAGEPEGGVTEFDFGDLSGRGPAEADSVVPPNVASARAAEPAYADDLYDRTDPVFDDSGHIPPYDGEAPVEPEGRGRGLFIVGGLLAIVLIGGIGALAYRGFGGEESSGPAPVIRADKSPTKVKPQQSDTAQAPQQGKLVYDRVSGDGGSEEATLVPREEAVADVGNRQVRVIDPNQDEANGLRGAATDTGAASAESGDLPKRVRTVVVKPDGTIVGEIQAPKPAEPLQPASLPGSNTTPAPAAETAASTDAPASGESAVPLPKPRPAELAMSQPAATAPATSAPAAPAPAPATPAPAPATTQSSQQPGNNFVPPSAPTSRANGAGPIQLQPAPATNSQSAPVQAAPTPAPATQTASAPATTTFPAGSYVVQVAASRDAQDAQTTAASITQNYSSVLSGYKPAVERADLGDRGIYYRVGVGPLQSQSAANTLCSKLKSAGLDCFVRRN